MDSSYSNGRYAFIKDPINCQTSSNYNYETYQSSYYDGEMKDINYYNNRVGSYPIPLNSCKVDQSQLCRPSANLSQPIGAVSTASVGVKSQPYKGFNYNAMPQDNNYYTFYDQYVNAKASQPLAKTMKIPTDYNGYTAPVQVQQSPKMVPNTLDPNMQISKSSSASSSLVMRNPNVSHYPYGSYYNFGTTSTPSYQQSTSNQNYYSAIAQANEDSRWTWGEYSTAGRTLPTYLPHDRSNYQQSYQSEALKYREKSYNPVYHTGINENTYGMRARHMWPISVQYQPPISQQSVYERSCAHSNATQSQPYNCYSTRQDDPTISNNYYSQNNSQYNNVPGNQPVDYKYYEPARSNDCLQQGYPDLSHMYPSDTSLPIRYSNSIDFSSESRYVPTERSLDEQNNLRSSFETYSQFDLNQQNRYTANQFMQSQSAGGINTNKIQNLRDFLSSWNEDEDENMEKLEKSLASEDIFLDSSNSGQQTGKNACGSYVENQVNIIDAQSTFKGSYSTLTRPKIHVGITVDSSIGSNQFINLPDIIIDIEKSKESVQTPYVNNTGLGKDKLATSTSIPTVVQLTEKHLGEAANNTCNYLDEKSVSINTELVTDIAIKESCLLMSSDILQINNVECSSTENDSKPLNASNKPDGNCQQKNIYTIKKIMKSLKNRKKRLLKRRSFMKKTMLKQSHLKHLLSLRRFRKPKAKGADVTHLKTPDSLKKLCLAFINTEKFREVLQLTTQIVHVQTEIKKYTSTNINNNNNSNNTNSNFIRAEEEETIGIDDDDNLTQNSNVNNIYFELQSPDDVPKLSDLCKIALNSSFDREEVVVINLDEIIDNDSLFVVQCDVNDNILDSSSISNDDQNNGGTSIEVLSQNQIKNDTVSQYDGNDNCANFQQSKINKKKCCNIINIYTDSDNDDDHQQIVNKISEDKICKDQISNEKLDYIIDNNSNKVINSIEEKPFDNDILVSSTFHHEEIVPDNYKKFENEKFLKYLHSKYVQRNISQIYHTNRILKKYRKGLFRKILQIVK